MNAPLKAGPDKRSVIADALLDGANSADMRQRLVDSGVSPAAADYELRRAQKDPMFAAAARIRRDLTKSYWVLGNYRTLHGQSAAGSVPVADAIDPQRFFSEFYFPNRPVKLTGLVDHWPAMRLWTLEYLAETVGASMVELQGQRGSADDYELMKDRHRRQMLMRDVVAAIRAVGSTNEFYVTAYNDSANKRSLARLWDDLGPVEILKESGGQDGFFWLGPKGTLTPLHHDLTNNLLVQVLGRKRVRLVPPWELERVHNHTHCFSQLTATMLEAAGDGDATPMECEIGRGEALFLPVGWWHHVEALDASISMSFTNFPYDNDFTAGHPIDPPPATGERP